MYTLLVEIVLKIQLNLQSYFRLRPTGNKMSINYGREEQKYSDPPYIKRSPYKVKGFAPGDQSPIMGEIGGDP